MGSKIYQSDGYGVTTWDAFVDAGGNQDDCYSGEIREKHEIHELDVPTGIDPVAYAEMIERAADRADHGYDAEPLDERIDRTEFNAAVEIFRDKWGPALAVKTCDKNWHFFGTAST